MRPEDLAAIIVEPVLGEGGFLVSPVTFLQELRDLATRYGIVLIHGRGAERIRSYRVDVRVSDVWREPDLMTVAKSLRPGMPLAAVVGRAPI